MLHVLGVNTWIWTSPLTDESLDTIARKAAAIGFGAIELPIEGPGDWDPGRARDLLNQLGLQPIIVGAMGPGRDLVNPTAIESTQHYLNHCVDVAATVGSTVVAGPFYATTGRTWRMSAAERNDAYAQLRESLRPVITHAAASGVTLAIEPLNRYETSLVNTVDQALDALGPLLGDHLGLALDTYHLNIEEKSITEAIERAGSHLVHVQVCGNDRGAVGDDHLDWSGILDALDHAGYTGPLGLESFTGDNATIAVAASIWRPLAASQDSLAARSYDYLSRLMSR